MRGITNRQLTAELALGLGKAIGTYFKEGSRILVGRDVRAGGDMLVRALTSGLLSTGIEVHYAGMLPTPALQYGIKNGRYAGGVMVTASHNPPEFNGIKVIDRDGVEADSKNEERIEGYYFTGRFRQVEWNKMGKDVIEEHGLIDGYVDGIVKLVDSKKIAKRRFKVLIDGGSSVGSLTTIKVAERLGCRISEINTELDPRFPNRVPEPTPRSLAGTASLAKKLWVDIAVAHDGDADRSIFIDSEGRVQYGDRSGALLSYWLSMKDRKEKRRIFTPFSSSNLVEEFLGERGVSTRWTRIGSIVVSRALMENGGLAGFEDNGGFIYPKHQYVRDGSMAFALMLELLSSTEMDSAGLFDTLPVYFTEKIKIPLSGKVKVGRILSDVQSEYKDRGKIVDTDDDGVKFVGEDFWFIVRKSGTEPVLRISVEARTKFRLNSVLEELKSLA